MIVLAVAGLIWAKWAPYWVKVPSVAESGSLGTSILLTGAGAAPPGVSLTAGLRFASDYFLAIWPALVVGLVLVAAVRTALPADGVRCAFGRGTGGAVSGSAGLAVVIGSVLLARWLDRDGVSDGTSLTLSVRHSPSITVHGAVDEAADGRSLPRRFLTALASITLRLLPEYLLLVVALGALRGVLFPLGSPLLMVRRVFPARLLTATTGLVVGVGLLTSAAATAL